MTECTVRIAWEDLETGDNGLCEPLDMESAEAWVRYMDEEYGATMKHWIVVEEEVKK